MTTRATTTHCVLNRSAGVDTNSNSRTSRRRPDADRCRSGRPLAGQPWAAEQHRGVADDQRRCCCAATVARALHLRRDQPPSRPVDQPSDGRHHRHPDHSGEPQRHRVGDRQRRLACDGHQESSPGPSVRHRPASLRSRTSRAPARARRSSARS